MAIKKSKIKSKSKLKSKAIKSKPVKKSKKIVAKSKSVAKPVEKISIKPVVEVRTTLVKRNPALVERRKPIRNASSVKLTKQFNFMKAPLIEYAFEVGDTVEVFCDHEKSRERIRGWIKGIVVQVDNKMVAVQFRSNVFLTDGWMVPDRILWYPLNSEHIRAVLSKKAIVKKEFVIPDY